MGQYFTWVNLDKGQYVEDDIFPIGYKFPENCKVGNLKTDAVCTLMGLDWAGDTVAFIGDYFGEKEADTPERRRVWELMGHQCLDDCMVDHAWRDVAGRFTYAQGKSRGVWREGDNPDYLDEEYDGPFDLEIESRRFVVNETKGAFYDREATEAWVRYDDGVMRHDPLPGYLGCGATFRYYEGEVDPSGTWIGDRISFSDERPVGYEDVSRQTWLYRQEPKWDLPEE